MTSLVLSASKIEPASSASHRASGLGGAGASGGTRAQAMRGSDDMNERVAEIRRTARPVLWIPAGASLGAARGDVMDKKEDREPKEQPKASPPAPLPASEPRRERPTHPTHHRHAHAVIHPANSSVTHTDPGGTIHI